MKNFLKIILGVFFLLSTSLSACNCSSDTASGDSGNSSGNGSIGGFFDDDEDGETPEDGSQLASLSIVRYFLSCDLENLCECGGVVKITQNGVISYEGSHNCSFESMITDLEWNYLEDELSKKDFFDVITNDECELSAIGNSTSYRVELENGESYSSSFMCDEPKNIDEVDEVINNMVKNYFPDASESWEYSH